MSAVTLVHDYLTQRGGAERVVLEMARAFPGAPLITSFFDPAATYPEFAEMAVEALPVDHIRPLRRNHRLALPVLAPAFSAARVTSPVALCSSSGWSHGIRAGGGRKVVYCHNPARWLYQSNEYLRDGPLSHRLALAAGRPALRVWDRRAAASVDRYLVNSHLVRRRVADTYGIEAEVLHPPVSLVPVGPTISVDGVEPGFYLCVSRLLPYKNVDSVVAAFAELPAEQLLVIGGGPLLERLVEAAPPNVHLCGEVDDAVLRWAYRSCRALVAASYEDFGLTPVEAAGFGKPTVALRWGGYLETIVEGGTGLFFDHPEPDRIRRALAASHREEWSERDIRRHAAAFSADAFHRRLQAVVGEELAALGVTDMQIHETDRQWPSSRSPGEKPKYA